MSGPYLDSKTLMIYCTFLRWFTQVFFFLPGRLYQVEYAMEAIGNAGTCLGILASDGVVLAAEKKTTNKLLDEVFASEKIYTLYEWVSGSLNFFGEEYLFGKLQFHLSSLSLFLSAHWPFAMCITHHALCIFHEISGWCMQKQGRNNKGITESIYFN